MFCFVLFLPQDDLKHFNGLPFIHFDFGKKINNSKAKKEVTDYFQCKGMSYKVSIVFTFSAHADEDACS